MNLPKSLARWLALAALTLSFTSCSIVKDRSHEIYVSVPDQRLQLRKDNVPIASWPVSTSKYGLGDQPGSRKTPLGSMEIARKIGDGVPSGTVFKSRKRTGEILPIDAPGRDPIVTRIIWLKGLEPQNQNAYARYIYIHGTPEERNIGSAVSYGCIRMRSRDVIQLFDQVGMGARVYVLNVPTSQFPAPASAATTAGTTPSP